MRKLLPVLMFSLFLFGCTGSPDKSKESTPEETETVINEKTIQELEESAKEIIDEAEELAKEVDDLIQNL